MERETPYFSKCDDKPQNSKKKDQATLDPERAFRKDFWRNTGKGRAAKKLMLSQKVRK